MKRGRAKDQLTGGSGDVNPQLVTVRITQAVPTTTVIAQFPIPIPRLPTREGKNLVIELLWVEYFELSAFQPVPNSSQYTLCVLTTTGAPSPSIGLALLDPRSLSQYYRTLVTGANQDGTAQTDGYFLDDLTDGAGHGLLLATDQFYLHLYSLNLGAPADCVVKFAYRWKEVSLVEYIGIVQSQQ